MAAEVEERIAELRQAFRGRAAGWVGRCLEALLLDDDARVRAEATAALEHATTGETVPPLVEALGSSLRYARRRAAQALVRLPVDPVRARLEAVVLADARGDRRTREAADLLGRLGDVRAVPTLLTALGAVDEMVRARAAAGLGVLLEQVGDEPPAGIEPDQAIAGLARLLGDSCPEAAVAAARSLGQIGRRRAVPALLPLLGVGGPLATEAVTALGRLGPGTLSTDDPAAPVWLGLTGGAGAPTELAVGLAELRRRLVQAQEPGEAGRAARALLTLGAPGEQALRQALDQATDELHDAPSEAGLLAAGRALWALPVGAGLPWSRLLAHPAARVRALGVRCLLRWGGAPAEAALHGAAADPDPTVAWLVERALALRAAGGWAAASATRLRPHARADRPSAQPPYGLPRPDDDGEPPLGPLPFAVAAFNLSISTNLGVLLRSAEAAGAAEVFVVGDPRYHPGAARGTDRYVRLTWLRDAAELCDRADAGGYSLVAVQQSPAALRYDLAPYPPKPLFVLGAEAVGVPASLRLAADLIIEIPLVGRIDSLNVATAGTIVLFDWLRRQGFPGTDG